MAFEMDFFVFLWGVLVICCNTVVYYIILKYLAK